MTPAIVLAPVLVPPRVNVRAAVIPVIAVLNAALEKVIDPVPLLKMLPAPALPAVPSPN